MIHLAWTDPVMARLVSLHGPPSFGRSGGDPFRALARSIVYQQVTGKAAATIFGRLEDLFGGQLPAPEALLATSDERLRTAGLSRQKISALRALAGFAAEGQLEREALEQLSDDDAVGHLTQVRGIGRWTAEMYLIDCGRPDVLPVSDLGLNKAMQRLYGLEDLPDAPEIEELGERWRPYASTACWYLWRSYDGPAPPTWSDL